MGYFIAGGVVSIVVGYLFYRAALRDKAPVWAIGSAGVWGSSVSIALQGLSLQYRPDPTQPPREVKTLTLSKVSFWNAGRAPIGENSKLEIEPADADTRILHREVVKRIPDNLEITADISGRGNVKISIGTWLNYQHGFMVQIAHTGKDSNSIRLTGSIEGAEIRQVSGFTGVPLRQPKNKLAVFATGRWLMSAFGWSVGCCGLVMLVGILGYIISPLGEFLTGPASIVIVPFVLAFVIFFLLLVLNVLRWMLILASGGVRRVKIPKSLRVWDEALWMAIPPSL